MLYFGTDPESYITENSLVYEDNRSGRRVCGVGIRVWVFGVKFQGLEGVKCGGYGRGGAPPLLS